MSAPSTVDQLERLAQDEARQAPSTKPGRKRARQPPRAERTLACFLQALEGMRLAIELRQDTVVRGVLESVDDDMNMVVTDATCTPLQGAKQELSWMYIKGHHIRFVHVPSRVDPKRIVEQNKRRIMQLRVLHNRELGQLPSLPKGSY